VTAVMLLFLAATGLVVWWPGIRRLARGFRVRRGQGTYAFNHDLHNVIGLAAIPFLVMWGFTGAHFELKQVSDLWYAVLPGQGADEREIESKPLPGRAVSMDQAAAIARRTVPDGRLVSVSVLDRKKTSAYLVWLSRGNDTYDHGVWPGTSASRSTATAARRRSRPRPRPIRRSPPRSPTTGSSRCTRGPSSTDGGV
jgi:uncharacterized iron-regulated membrane protein